MSNITQNAFLNENDIIYIKNNIINVVYQKLISDDKQYLLEKLIALINYIAIRFCFVDKNRFMIQLKQNKNRDLCALLNMLMPFISDNDNDDSKKSVVTFNDLYTKKDSKGEYLYTNMQYNRAIRSIEYQGNQLIINTKERELKREYLDHNFILLLYTIQSAAMKLYVNWVDIVPFTLESFKKHKYYQDTLIKLRNRPDKFKNETPLEERSKTKHLDWTPGMSYQDIYHGISYLLFTDIKNHKWLIYDFIDPDNNLPVTVYRILTRIFVIDDLLSEKSWQNLTDDQILKIGVGINKMLQKSYINDKLIFYFYFFFTKYYDQIDTLKNENILIDLKIDEEDEDEAILEGIEELKLDDIYKSIRKIPSEHIYNFLLNEITFFKKTWYYHKLKSLNTIDYLYSNASSKSQQQEKKTNVDTDTLDSMTDFFSQSNAGTIYITVKNVYNYAKSILSYTDDHEKYIQMPPNWISLSDKSRNGIKDKDESGRVKVIKSDIKLFIERILLPFDSSSNDILSWFNISNNIRTFYSLDFTAEDKRKIQTINHGIFYFIKKNIAEIIFEAYIYSGLLSEFIPQEGITNTSFITKRLRTEAFDKVNQEKYRVMKEVHFGSRRKEYETQAYYFATHQTYGELNPLRKKNFDPVVNYKKKYFDFLTEKPIWMFTYAMNWCSQINFIHRYINNRVIYVTGSTGQGKSTQVPKLFLYALYAISFNKRGKIICTQPRQAPTLENIDTISNEMGLPIFEYTPELGSGLGNKTREDITTYNYLLQYKYKTGSFVNANTPSFLRMVTDGTLLEEMKNSQFLTHIKGKKITAANLYDIIMVDEAHEHNTNMDIILSFAKDMVNYNNSLKLVIVSATMEDDDPIYRRYYRVINDNRSYPLSTFLINNRLDRANVDRRFHISPPGSSTQYVIKDFYLTDAQEEEMKKEKSYIDYAVKRTIDLAQKTKSGDILLFLPGENEIKSAIKQINNHKDLPDSIIALGYFRSMNDKDKEGIQKIHQTLPNYTRRKQDVLLKEYDIKFRVQAGTYTRAIIIATNIAEASLTLEKLRYVVDSGKTKVNIYDPLLDITRLPTYMISQTSSTQRKGRVGRVAPGEVYYLYKKEEVMYNKTRYKIADEDPTTFLKQMIKKSKYDSPIIYHENDPNGWSHLMVLESESKIIKFRDKTDKKRSREISLDNLLKIYKSNILEDIYFHYYMLIPDLETYSTIFRYIGRATLLNSTANYQYDSFNLIQADEKSHDDYNFQRIYYKYQYGTTASGYDTFVLLDKTLDFYIIHPDENILVRDKLTGALKAIRYDCDEETVSKKYYPFVDYFNKEYSDSSGTINIMDKLIQKKSYMSPKLLLSFDSLERGLMLIQSPYDKINLNDKDLSQMIKHSNPDYLALTERNYIKTLDATIMDDFIIKEFINFNLASDMDISTIDGKFIFWFLYAWKFNLELDVIGVILFLKHIIGYKEAYEKSDIKYAKYGLKKDDQDRGDIYHIWQIWRDVNEVFKKNHIYNLFSIDENINQLTNKFNELKNRFISGDITNLDGKKYRAMRELEKQGKLRSRHSFYYYIDSVYTNEIEVDKFIENFKPQLDLVRNTYTIDEIKFESYINEIIYSLQSWYKNIWCVKYKINSGDPELFNVKKITENLETYLGERNSNIISIGDFLKNLTTNKNPIEAVRNLILYPESDRGNEWENFRATYIRAYFNRCVKFISDPITKKTNYLSVTTFEPVNIAPIGAPPPSILAKKDTTVMLPQPYLLYNTISLLGNEIIIKNLTPVTIKEIIKVNPLYYHLYKMKQNEKEQLYHASKEIWEDINSHFNVRDLMEFLQYIKDPYVHELVKKIDN
jgi:hypothetical protein